MAANTIATSAIARTNTFNSAIMLCFALETHWWGKSSAENRLFMVALHEANLPRRLKWSRPHHRYRNPRAAEDSYSFAIEESPRCGRT